MKIQLSGKGRDLVSLLTDVTQVFGNVTFQEAMLSCVAYPRTKRLIQQAYSCDLQVCVESPTHNGAGRS